MRRRGLWCPWVCVGWRGAQMMMKLLSGISAILAVSYGWEGSKINPILRDLVGTGFWRQKTLVCTPYPRVRSKQQHDLRETSSKGKTMPNLQGCGQNNNKSSGQPAQKENTNNDRGEQSSGQNKHKNNKKRESSLWPQHQWWRSYHSIPAITTNTKTTRNGNQTHDNINDGVDGIKLITNSERLIYVLWFARSVHPPLSVH